MCDFSYTFKNKGLYFIEGKSGSGKSTIANLAALYDVPSKGEIYYKNTNINKYSKKRIDSYHSKDMAMIFQHYNLLLEETVLFNVLMPTFAFNLKSSKNKEKAKFLLEQVGIDEHLFSHKAKDLSGGEMQRVAIARALINDPSIIIADEPTGALDEENSKIVMHILKEISKEKLVILISHNKELVNEYCDYTIRIKDGKLIEKNIIDSSTKEYEKEKPIKKGHDDGWINKIIFKRLKKNITRNVLVFLSLVFSFSFLVAMIGFIDGSSIMANEISYRKIDYGFGTLSFTETKHINNSSLSLKKMTKIPLDELIKMEEIFDHFHVMNSYDYLLPPTPSMKISDKAIEQIFFSPIYSFNDPSIDETLLLKGSFPKNNKGVVVNKLVDEKISKLLNLKTSIGQILTLDIVKEIDIQTYKGISVEIKDTFVYDKSFVITGIVDEFNFLSNPKIYYSYKQLEEELQMNIMTNLSYKFNEEITFYDYINVSPNTSIESSYMHRVFLKNINSLKSCFAIVDSINEKYKVELSLDSIVMTSTFNDLMSAATFGVSLFVFIALAGSILILAIASFSSYIFEKRNTAIMYAFGINKNQVSSIFLGENLFVTLLAVFVSLILSPFLINALNGLIFNIFGFANLILNPLQKMNILTVFYVICIILLISLVVYLSTITPIELSGKINIKEELSDE